LKNKSVINVLFVCLGNICRSPTAHGVFQKMINDKHLQDKVEVESAGTSDWHIGNPPDKRSAAQAKKNGYDLSFIRGRQVQTDDFAVFDYILAMDEANLAELKELAPLDYEGHLSLFLDFSDDADYREVPDPYYGGGEGFQVVLSLIEGAAAGLLQEIQDKLNT